MENIQGQVRWGSEQPDLVEDAPVRCRSNWPNPIHREVCCLPGAWVRDITKELPSLVWPIGYYQLLVSQRVTNKDPTRSLQTSKRVSSALRQLVKGSGEQVVFSSVLRVLDRSEELHLSSAISTAINSDISIFFLQIFIGITFIRIIFIWVIF